MTRHGLHVPSSMTQLSRALLTLDGTLRIIAPTFDLSTEATGLVRDLGEVEEASPDNLLRQEVLKALPILRGLPEQVDELATQLRDGRMSVRVQRFAENDQTVVDRWIDRALLAFVGSAGALVSAVLLLAANVSHSVDVGDALRAIGFIGLVLSVVLLLRSVARILQRDGPRATRRSSG